MSGSGRPSGRRRGGAIRPSPSRCASCWKISKSIFHSANDKRNMDYIELHCHSNFSLLDGASFPEALVAQAVTLEMPALALTDHDAVYGAVGFVRAAQTAGIKPMLGTELTLVGDHHLTLLVENAAGWQNLCTLISVARANAPKGHAALPPEALAGHTAG